eukprot:1752911-Lingulodinium_polyedra.AAC.1
MGRLWQRRRAPSRMMGAEMFGPEQGCRFGRARGSETRRPSARAGPRGQAISIVTRGPRAPRRAPGARAVVRSQWFQVAREEARRVFGRCQVPVFAEARRRGRGGLAPFSVE